MIPRFRPSPSYVRLSAFSDMPEVDLYECDPYIDGPTRKPSLQVCPTRAPSVALLCEAGLTGRSMTVMSRNHANSTEEAPVLAQAGRGNDAGRRREIRRQCAYLAPLGARDSAAEACSRSGARGLHGVRSHRSGLGCQRGRALRRGLRRVSGRIRTIKPEWLEDELLSSASPEARVLSIALLLLADDFGNGRAGIAQLAGRVFPGKVLETVAKALEELEALRFVVRYELDGQRYFSIRNWAKHQKVDKVGKPRVPGPPGALANVPETVENVPASRASYVPGLGSGQGTDPGQGQEREPPAASAHVRNFEASFGSVHPDDQEAFRRWMARFRKSGSKLDPKRAQYLEDRRLEGMTLDDFDSALEGAAVDDWVKNNGFKLALILANRESYEGFRDTGRQIREGKYQAPKRANGREQPKGPNEDFERRRAAREAKEFEEQMADLRRIQGA